MIELERKYTYPTGVNPETAREVWDIFLESEAFITRPADRPFELASGRQATIKVDAEAAFLRPVALRKLLGIVAAQECVRRADALLYVPDGMRNFTELLGEKLTKEVIALEKVQGSARGDFVFATDADCEKAQTASRPTILEDVVTSGGSYHSVVKLLPGAPKQDIHMQALLLRGELDSRYSDGVTPHFLCERSIPMDTSEFFASLPTDELARIAVREEM